jgi:retinoid X receptor beta
MWLHHYPLLTPDVRTVPAVQEERQRNKEQGREEVESTTVQNDMSVQLILEAEITTAPNTTLNESAQTDDAMSNITMAADKQLQALVEWAKRVPHFGSLCIEDQVLLLRSGMLTMLRSKVSKVKCLCLESAMVSASDHVLA